MDRLSLHYVLSLRKFHVGVTMVDLDFLRKTSYNGYKPSYWHSVGTKPLSHLTVGQLVDIAAERRGTREAVVSVYQGHRFTFSEARDKVNVVTNKWRNGVQTFPKYIICNF
jgi:hypothetical protein